jgi:hypothetical protein
VAQPRHFKLLAEVQRARKEVKLLSTIVDIHVGIGGSQSGPKDHRSTEYKKDRRQIKEIIAHYSRIPSIVDGVLDSNHNAPWITINTTLPSSGEPDEPPCDVYSGTMGAYLLADAANKRARECDE